MASVSSARFVTLPVSVPSDLIILRPPRGESVGHTVIVTEQVTANLTDAEAKTLSRAFPALAVPGKAVVKVSVASSFGYEGPQERVWVYDPETKSWGDLGGQLFDDNGAGRRTPTGSIMHSGPWDHDYPRHVPREVRWLRANEPEHQRGDDDAVVAEHLETAVSQITNECGNHQPRHQERNHEPHQSCVPPTALKISPLPL